MACHGRKRTREKGEGRGKRGKGKPSSTVYGSLGVPFLCPFSLVRFSLDSISLANRFEQHNSCRDRNIEAADRAEHRNRGQAIAAFADQAAKARSLGAEHERRWDGEIAAIVALRCGCSSS